MGDAVPILRRATAHDRGAMPRALFPARNPHSHKARAKIGSRTAICVVEIGVARVDDQIVLAQQGLQGGNLVIHGLTCGNHQDDSPGRGDGGD